VLSGVKKFAHAEFLICKETLVKLTEGGGAVCLLNAYFMILTSISMLTKQISFNLKRKTVQYACYAWLNSSWIALLFLGLWCADPRDSETFRPADLHHGMEVRLGLSKGPICPTFVWWHITKCLGDALLFVELGCMLCLVMSWNIGMYWIPENDSLWCIGGFLTVSIYGFVWIPCWNGRV